MMTDEQAARISKRGSEQHNALLSIADSLKRIAESLERETITECRQPATIILGAPPFREEAA